MPAGSGIDGDAALALATTAAVSRAPWAGSSEPDELVALAREAARASRARPTSTGYHAALCGGRRADARRAGGARGRARSASTPAGSRSRCCWWTPGAPERGRAGEPARAGRERVHRTGRDRRGALAAAATRTSSDLVGRGGRGAAPSGPGQRPTRRGARARGGRGGPAAGRGAARGRLGAAGRARAGPPRGGQGGAQGGRPASPLAVRVDLRGLEVD